MPNWVDLKCHETGNNALEFGMADHKNLMVQESREPPNLTIASDFHTWSSSSGTHHMRIGCCQGGRPAAQDVAVHAGTCLQPRQKQAVDKVYGYNCASWQGVTHQVRVHARSDSFDTCVQSEQIPIQSSGLAFPGPRLAGLCLVTV